MKYLKTLLLLLPIVFISCVVNKKDTSNFSQSKINIELRQELETVLLKDQGIRKLLSSNISAERKAQLLSEMKISEKDLEGNKKYSLIREIDSANLESVEEIINKYGYPSKSIVGEAANKAIFYVIQHSKKIDKYLPLIRKATKNGDVATTSLALMEDRNLMYKGVEQIYGTQIKGQTNKRGEWIYFLWPIKNADSINIRRKEAGFQQTIEEYAKEMDVEFKLYKINELKGL
jgi:cupin superfamily acireductone dioxygenase involved in methionine salvage